ncbi:hypothetical protein AB0P17_24480 [Streptomyces sp. NPDC088124]|uniref:hypothetical protein n=1 Tax=Streptomyces sp. NPDC088124 TaxID=3154654 RepID=UPI0034300AD0
MAKKFFRVTAQIRSLNKPAVAKCVTVKADNEDDARKQAKNEIHKQYPQGTVTIGTVRDPKP